MVRLTINGKSHGVDVEPDTPLLWAIRENVGLTGTKYGCGIAQCGACTVHIDGTAVRSCGMTVGEAAGKQITTIEGLAAGGALHKVQQAWINNDVPQCGYCQSGMIMAVAELLKLKPKPTDADIDREITNICRCGTFQQVRAAIHADVCQNGLDAARNTFVRAYDDPTLDASLLLIADLGFIAASDPRFAGTVAAMERELLAPSGLVMRYDTASADDGLPPGEGAFLACSFWLVNAYVALGRRDEAERLFTRLLALANDVGLLAEEYDSAAARLVGNFPQAFSHVGLINAAFALERGA